MACADDEEENRLTSPKNLCKKYRGDQSSPLQNTLPFSFYNLILIYFYYTAFF